MSLFRLQPHVIVPAMSKAVAEHGPRAKRCLLLVRPTTSEKIEGRRALEVQAAGTRMDASTAARPGGAEMQGQKGFSVVELLVVVAIMLLIAAIAIPNLLRARLSANESSAAAAIRSITVAEIAYFGTYPTIGYAVQLQDLGRPVSPCTPAAAHACLLDNSLAQAVPGSTGHSGYQFLATGIDGGAGLNSSFVAAGTPLVPNRTGTRDFCTIADGALRNQPATGGTPPTSLAACIGYPVAP